jgi:CHAT domain-containing protein
MAPGTPTAVPDEAKELATALLRHPEALPDPVVAALRGLLAPAPSSDEIAQGLAAIAAVEMAVEAARAEETLRKLPQSLAEWYRTPSWPASRAWLAEHLPELPPDAPEQFRAAAQSAREDDANLAEQLERHAALVERARREGVDAAYRAIIGERAFVESASGGPPDVMELNNRLVEWIQTPDWGASRAYLKAHPDLLSEAAEALLTMLRDRQQSDQARQAVEEHQALLRDAREHGIDAAYDRFLAQRGGNGSSGSAELDALMTELIALIASQGSPTRQEELCRRILALDDTLRVLSGQNRAAVLLTRGNALQNMAQLSGGSDAKTLRVEAIACYDAALLERRREVAPLNWAMTQNNKGNALRDLAGLLAGAERRTTLEAAVACYDAALLERRREVAPLNWAMTQNNKGTALSDLAGLLAGAERRATLEAAVACYDAALLERRREVAPLNWAMTQNNKGTALSDLAGLLAGAERRTTLEAAVACYDAALLEARREVAPLDWATTQNNKGTALRDLAGLLAGAERRTTLEAAVACYDAALLEYRREVAPLDWAMTQNNKGTALRDLAGLLAGAERRATLEAAVACYDGPFISYPRELFAGQHRGAARALAAARLDLALELDGTEASAELARAWEAAESGLEATRALERQAPSLGFRQEEWAEAAGLYTLAAIIQAQRSNPREAALLLEAGRARGLAEIHSRRHADLTRLTTDERNEYERAVRAVQQAEAHGRQVSDLEMTTLVEEARGANERLAAVVTRLREAHPDFLPERTPTIEHLRASLRRDEALVYLAPQTAGTLVVLVSRSGEPRAELLRDLTSDAIFDLAVQPDASGRNRLGYLPAAVGWGPTPLDQALDALLPALGDRLMRRVAELARGLELRRAVLVPGGFLAVLPLHAASYLPLSPADAPTAPNGRRYACDDLAITYAPSGAAYAESRAAAERLGRPKRGFVVGNPQLSGAGHRWAQGMRGYLPFAAQEAATVAGLMREADFEAVTESLGADATWSAVVAGMQSHDVAHLAMHALFDPEQPLRSALLVAPDARLYLRDLLNERLMTLTNLRLAVLSACQSGLGDFQRFSEEAVGLFGGLLASGAAGVIGSLWPVFDSSAGALMESFTRHYLLDGLEPDDALRAAQGVLRGVAPSLPQPASSAPSQAAGEQLIAAAEQIAAAAQASAAAPEQVAASQGTAAAEPVVSRWLAMRDQGAGVGVRQLPGIPGEQQGDIAGAEQRRDFSHPIHWAAFVYYGA